ncbi:hypothetical protein [Chitinophaga filiformis]|uniref:Uncharacterized protein n=1 Tax=Chitinophaga filiformis TaxID=104663 RepID=A0ABY4IBG8_CHIFI|nr:hypothetical protein [Chitinophaga filiformis]UPK72900.1 hypothetical protein MYF79_16540 [Chitinophaga filiformis]
MYRKQRVSAGRAVALLALLSAISVERGLIASPKWYFILCITAPVMLLYGFARNR